MRSLIFVTALLPVITIALNVPTNDAELVKEIVKRELDPDSKGGYDIKEYHNFVENKLIELTQAAQHLVQLVQDNGKTIKILVDNFAMFLQKPKLPEKVEAKQKSSRISEDESRRIYAQKPLTNLANPTSLSKVDEPNSWCSVAILCLRTVVPVCGYDDNFGYGRFDDLCHLLQVNCYWNYNFSVVSSC